MTGVMEAEPELVDQLLSHRCDQLPQRVITLGYHPAHARGATFHRGGSFNSFKRVLDVIGSHGVGVETFERVFAAANAAALDAGAATVVRSEPVAAH
jgi:hypothetical protein